MIPTWVEEDVSGAQKKHHNTLFLPDSPLLVPCSNHGRTRIQTREPNLASLSAIRSSNLPYGGHIPAPTALEQQNSEFILEFSVGVTTAEAAEGADGIPTLRCVFRAYKGS